MKVRLPSPSRIEDPVVREYLSELVQGLERALEKLPETPFMKDQVKLSAVFTELYSFDPTTATLDDLRRIVATIVSRLRASGVFP